VPTQRTFDGLTHFSVYHRRALALGVVACSSSLGGTIFPIVVKK
jgi:hypothetical protein